MVKSRIVSAMLETLLVVAEFHQREERLTLETLVDKNFPGIASSTTKYVVEKLKRDGYVVSGREGVSRRTQVRTTYRLTKKGVEFLGELHNRLSPILGCGYDALG